jgi:hypothetical protein
MLSSEGRHTLKATGSAGTGYQPRGFPCRRHFTTPHKNTKIINGRQLLEVLAAEEK